MSKIIVAGSATIDLIFQCNELEAREQKGRWNLAHGGKYLADNHFLTYGGGGANAAVCLSKLGHEVWLWTKLGQNQFGIFCRKNLQKNKVKTTLITTTKLPNAISSVIIDKTGDKTIFNYRSDADNLVFTQKMQNTLKKCSWLALFSLARWDKEQKMRLLKMAKKYNVNVFLSLHGSEYKKGLSYLKDYLPYISIMHLNVYEAADLLKTKIENINFYKDNLTQKINIPLLLVSHDSVGSYAYTKQNIYFQTSFKPSQITDTTGAGDAFGASFLGTFIKSADIAKALAFSARNASSVIEKFGAQNGLIAKSRF